MADNIKIYGKLKAYTEEGKVADASDISGLNPIATEGLTQAAIIQALGYTPYDSSNPNGYITSQALTGYATKSEVIPYYRVSSFDCNDTSLSGSSIYRVNATPAHAANSNYSVILNFLDLGTPIQIQIPDAGERYVYKRTKSSGTWQNWFKMSAGDSDTVAGLSVHSGRNNEANKVVRTDGNGYIQAGYINSSSGDENNYSEPVRIWGTNGSDSYLRTYNATSVCVGRVYGSYSGNGGQQGPDYYGRNRVGFLMSNQPVNGYTNYTNWIYMDNYNGNDVGGASAIGVARTQPRAFIMQSDANRSSWNNIAELISTYNIGEQSVARVNGGQYTWDGVRPYTGMKPFYNWDVDAGGINGQRYCVGFAVGSHPADQNYGFEIGQNLWDDRLYIRRYNNGWETQFAFAYMSDIPSLDGCAKLRAHNDLLASGNEFTFASSGFVGTIYFNYRTAGGTNGDITEYVFGNGKGGSLGSAIHTGNISSYAIMNAGDSPNLNDGTTITQPGGEYAISIKTPGSAHDTGIFRLSADNAYICNSSDIGYTFGVFDTDLTRDFSENNLNAASFVVLKDGSGCKIRGNRVLHSGNTFWPIDGNALYVDATSGSKYALLNFTSAQVEIRFYSSSGTLMRTKTLVGGCYIIRFLPWELTIKNISSDAGYNEGLTLSNYSRIAFYCPGNNHVSVMNITDADIEPHASYSFS